MKNGWALMFKMAWDALWARRGNYDGSAEQYADWDQDNQPSKPNKLFYGPIAGDELEKLVRDKREDQL